MRAGDRSEGEDSTASTLVVVRSGAVASEGVTGSGEIRSGFAGGGSCEQGAFARRCRRLHQTDSGLS